MPKGIVKCFDEERGFGFITRAGKDDMFVHITKVLDETVSTLVKGQRVSFEEGISTTSGKPEARKVAIIT